MKYNLIWCGYLKIDVDSDGKQGMMALTIFICTEGLALLGTVFTFARCYSSQVLDSAQAETKSSNY